MRIAPVMPPRSSALVRTNDAAPLAMKSAVFRWAPSEVSATQSGHANALAQPFVGGDAELADRLLVPEVAGVGERVPEVDRVGQVEARRAVVHKRHVVADVLAHGGGTAGRRRGRPPRRAA